MVINGLLPSILWYHAANIHFPSWALQEIEDIISAFLWDNKRPTINRDILALSLTEGELNIPRIAWKIQALRLNMIRCLLSHEQAHWKFLTSHFLRLSHMATGKHTLALHFNTQHIDPSIPHFHKDLLTAWLQHTNHHKRTNMPTTLPDVLHEPLFRNPLITANNSFLYHRDWIKAGIITIRDLCYAVVPGFLRALAIHEILTHQDDNPTRKLQHTIHELTEIQQALPTFWTRLICTHTTLQRPTLQPVYAIPSLTPNTPDTPLDHCKTKHFYHHLQQNKPTLLPALKSECS